MAKTEKAREAMMKRSSKKPQMARKKNPQQKIKSHFSTKKNQQGFPMHQCRYQPEEGKCMCHPPGHGSLFARDPNRFMERTPVHCKDCKLQPCLVKEHSLELNSKGAVLTILEKKSEADTRAIILEDLQKKHCGLFKRKFSVRRFKPTECMQNHVNFWHADTDEDSDSDGDDILYGPTAMACLSMFGKKK